jgi:serine protease AprX
VNGPDLSFESQADNTRYLDGYGHGTHMAGIMAGRDPQVVAGQEADPNDPALKLTGRGVGIALIDTGVVPVQGLANKVVNGPDLSFESQADNTRYLDGYGHGTHMAGIMAGRDAQVVAGHEADTRHFVGMAPDAEVVSVKVATGDGGADVSQIIAGIDWVVQHKAEHNIRVLNLSYGTTSTQAADVDPLAHAVENAWRAGIVVVVAAGNDGESGATRLTMPAVDPYVLAVGSSEHHGSEDATQTTLGASTNAGTAERRPDLVAPGKSVVGLRAPGSLADLQHPEGLVTGDTTGRLFRGTGTSQSAAVVSGAAALLLQRDPGLTPDQVKGVLEASADHLADDNPTQGAGQLDVAGAVELLEAGGTAAYTQTWPVSTGLGSLEASRGDSHVADPETGDVLEGEQDIFGVAWDAADWASASAQNRTWSDGEWRGSTWTGRSWAGRSWAGAEWTNRTWSNRTWSNRTWSTMEFLNRTWSGDDWTNRTWSADNWTNRTWSNRTWSNRTWTTLASEW